MKRSRVVGQKDEGDIHDIRTSAGTFLARNLDPVLTTVDERLAMWSGLPPSHQEDMQASQQQATQPQFPSRH
ncbi:Fe2OG dioxygenase domain-containing protein [Haematococcus lacustris]|uniref:Fe2OG dioxygenase domain-containing protein n=1 Tax=Haematococcus lacustris TaxID=44745 RepID=A0A699Z0U4_HAELA|nr:Fe2OG dioxygenase domain-containing protein [Haematococcus lacustris]